MGRILQSNIVMQMISPRHCRRWLWGSFASRLRSLPHSAPIPGSPPKRRRKPFRSSSLAEPIQPNLDLPVANRPAGNLTGVSFLTELITAKRLEVLHEIAPKAVRIGLLVNPTVAQTENAPPKKHAPTRKTDSPSALRA